MFQLARASSFDVHVRACQHLEYHGIVISRMTWRDSDDPWLGALHQFPTVLHARALLSLDVSPESLQKALLSALFSFRTTSLSREITIADRKGYSEGRVRFKIGISNGEGFDTFNARAAERVRGRIAKLGPLDTMDLAFNIHYAIRDGRQHRVHGDDYIVRLVFQSQMAELLVHHLKGVRRVEPTELLELLVRELNSELSRKGLSKVELASVSST